MTDDELKTFQKMFPEFHKYLLQNPKSILARIYGIFTVQMEDIVPINLILMGNTIQCEKPEDIHSIFDLKGSIINRIVKGHNHSNN